jgi:hypothetical protein
MNAGDVFVVQTQGAGDLVQPPQSIDPWCSQPER